MGLLGTLTGLATSGMDLFVGGQLAKAKLSVDKADTRAQFAELEFQFNPETIKVTREQARTSAAVHGTENKREDQNSAPAGKESRMQLSNIIFDTYEQKPGKSVYKEYIETLEKFVGYDQDKHAPPYLLFTWGKFTEQLSAAASLKCKLDTLDVDYTMFLNDGTPVRAKVDMTLRVGLTSTELQEIKEQHSPDHAKLVTVQRGQSLSDIAADEYDNPGEWRRIANANDIDDPMSIEPGTKLIVPPILG